MANDEHREEAEVSRPDQRHEHRHEADNGRGDLFAYQIRELQHDVRRFGDMLQASFEKLDKKLDDRDKRMEERLRLRDAAIEANSERIAKLESRADRAEEKATVRNGVVNFIGVTVATLALVTIWQLLGAPT